MRMTDIDKTKIRTATKCFLMTKQKATAKQIWDYIMKCDLKIRRDITVNQLARELTYCCKTKTFMNLAFEDRERDNTRLYYLEAKK